MNSRRSFFFRLESSKNELKMLTEDRIKSDELKKTFEDNCIRLQTELDLIKRDLEERNRDLKKERIRIENMIRQEEVKSKNRFTRFSFLFIESSIKTKYTHQIQ